MYLRFKTPLSIIMDKTVSVQTATKETVAISKLSPGDPCHSSPEWLYLNGANAGSLLFLVWSLQWQATVLEVINPFPSNLPRFVVTSLSMWQLPVDLLRRAMFHIWFMSVLWNLSASSVHSLKHFMIYISMRYLLFFHCPYFTYKETGIQRGEPCSRPPS